MYMMRIFISLIGVLWTTLWLWYPCFFFQFTISFEFSLFCNHAYLCSLQPIRFLCALFLSFWCTQTLMRESVYCSECNELQKQSFVLWIHNQILLLNFSNNIINFMIISFIFMRCDNDFHAHFISQNDLVNTLLHRPSQMYLALYFAVQFNICFFFSATLFSLVC